MPKQYKGKLSEYNKSEVKVIWNARNGNWGEISAKGRQKITRREREKSISDYYFWDFRTKTGTLGQ